MTEHMADVAQAAESRIVTPEDADSNSAVRPSSDIEYRKAVIRLLGARQGVDDVISQVENGSIAVAEEDYAGMLKAYDLLTDLISSVDAIIAGGNPPG